ncbi:MAG: hypothetical protein LRZ85_08965 [Alphaproteobacteria bacterium]|nr:hypothetical protein [Alphaproteobacteria bacterium]MCD8520518.1 hypothetical protein [Alphaproteobacteria bacterium]MCD8570639.1 hypothetical protein [Alphaproteobacteria bacterium]
MPFDPNPPPITGALSKAHKDAQALISEGIYRVTGQNYADLSAPPPLKAVARVYINMMGLHIAETMLARSAAFAEQAARVQDMHAAALEDEEGNNLGYTTYIMK